MFGYLLITHSIFRWLVIVQLLFTLVYLIFRKYKKRIYSKKDFNLSLFTCLILNIQLILGILLFIKSPVAQAFWNNLNEAVKWREIRFFGLEHPTMMIIGVFLCNYFTYKSKKHIGTSNGFRYLLQKYYLILFFIFSSIPWSFSPLTSRPSFRFF